MNSSVRQSKVAYTAAPRSHTLRHVDDSASAHRDNGSNPSTKYIQTTSDT